MIKPFAYLRDPLFLTCVALHFLNRWAIGPHLPNAFSQSYLNDVICIPFWLPIMLFAMRKTGLRQHDDPPRAHEILIPLIVWSIAFELVAPFTATFRGLAFSDPWDILCYASGALIASLIWRFWYEDRTCALHAPIESPEPSSEA